jgi:hypothetical protein
MKQQHLTLKLTENMYSDEHGQSVNVFYIDDKGVKRGVTLSLTDNGMLVEKFTKEVDPLITCI